MNLVLGFSNEKLIPAYGFDRILANNYFNLDLFHGKNVHESNMLKGYEISIRTNHKRFDTDKQSKVTLRVLLSKYGFQLRIW